MHESGKILIRKLDEFIRKYYRNQLIRGAVITVAFLAGSFLLFVLLEYLFRFGNIFRLILFYSYILAAIGLIAFFIIQPILKIKGIGKILSYEQAATIIGDHFPAIADKLLNTLQLMDQEQSSSTDLPLLIAGIDQKIKMIRPFNFTLVINLKKNRKYLKYAIPPLLLILAGVFITPSVISVPAERIIRYNKTFVKELPYSFRILNEKLEILQQSDFELRIGFSGEEIPDEVFCKTGEVTFQMHKEKGFTYSYTFRSVQKDIEFMIIAGELTSGPFRIHVIPKPTILSFETLLEYPAYIKRPPEKLANTGDLNIPEGTRVTWNLDTKDAGQVWFRFPDGMIRLNSDDDGRMSCSKKMAVSGTYSMTPRNAFVTQPDSMVFRINLIPDAYPSIFVQETSDSSMLNDIFFRGTIKDDYGFNRLEFHCEVRKAGDSAVAVKKIIPVAIDNSLNSQVFFFRWEPGSLMTDGGEEIRYYFEVWDNDGIHGPKCTRSENRLIKTPTLQEISEKTAENEHDIISELKNSLKESESINKSLDDLNRKMVEKNTLNFQERKKVEDLIKSTEKMRQTMEEIKRKNEENINNSDYLRTSQNILEKQKRLNELMDELMTDEMKKLMQDIRDLLDKMDKNKLAEAMDKMKKSQEDIEQQLDRNLQLFKQIEFDRKLEETINSLRENAQKQDQLSEKSEKGQEGDNQKLSEEQQKLKDAFNDIRKELNELREKEKDLENPPGIEKTNNLQDSISNNMDKSQSMLKQGKQKQAAGNQKKSSQQMNKLADQLEQMNADAEMQQAAEDAGQIRIILENLIRMSFEQENLIALTQMTNRNDPKFQELIYRQKGVKDKLKSSEDSLISIGKRQFIIAPVINRKIKEINSTLEEIVTALNNRSVSLAQSKQQFTMTDINDLANLLDESLKQMNQNMANSMKGTCQKQCSNPSNSGGKQKIKGIRDMQEKMSGQLKSLKEGLEKMGKDQNGQKKMGQNPMNEQIARMAAEQEAIRNAMERYKQELEEQGIKDGGNAAKAIQDMDQNERDLLNKKISQETILRQERIITRLLNSEKAEMEREMQEKRESREQKDQNYRNFIGNNKYNIQKSGGKEVIEYRAAPLNLYYRNRVNEYMIKIGQ